MFPEVPPSPPHLGQDRCPVPKGSSPKPGPGSHASQGSGCAQSLGGAGTGRAEEGWQKQKRGGAEALLRSKKEAGAQLGNS